MFDGSNIEDEVPVRKILAERLIRCICNFSSREQYLHGSRLNEVGHNNVENYQLQLEVSYGTGVFLLKRGVWVCSFGVLLVWLTGHRYGYT